MGKSHQEFVSIAAPPRHLLERLSYRTPLPLSIFSGNPQAIPRFTTGWYASKVVPL